MLDLKIKLIKIRNTFVLFMFLSPIFCESQTISAVTFPAGKQLGLTDTIRINATAGTPNSIAGFENYTFNQDTIIINLKHCISYLAIYGTVTVLTKVPPQLQGKYKVKINLKTFDATKNPQCNLEFERHIWFDSIEVNSKYTSLNYWPKAAETLKVYPIPLKNILRLEQSYLINKIIIVNLIGETIFEVTEPKPEIDVSFLKSGVYFVTAIKANNQVITTKIIKE